MLDSAIKANKNYYSQTFLEEPKYVQEKIKTENYQMKIQNQTVTLMMKQSLTLTMMNMTNKLKKYFNTIKA